MDKKNKIGSSQVGFAIIAMALLLLVGSIFVDDNYDSKSTYLRDKGSNNKYIDSNTNLPNDYYLFYLNNTDIGRQKKVTESFPNIELGSIIENNIIYIGNNFKLSANPFTSNKFSFNVNFDNPKDVDSFLLYFTPNRRSGSQDLIISIDNEIMYSNSAAKNELPIQINKKLTNTSVKVTFELAKPRWYQIFNWNKFEVEELKVMEVRHNKDNDEKVYSFQVQKDFIERVELNLVVDCDENTEAGKPIRVEVNDYTITDFNPDCTSSINRKQTREIPLNILSSQKNDLVFKTAGYYKLAYSINKIYFNDQQTYKFTISNFNDIYDVVMYGDFDKEIIDVKINTQIMSLRRDEIKSIIQYLRFGTNELKILTKPVEIKEFIIEKNEFYS